MLGPEALLAVGLGAAYLEARHLVKDDLSLITKYIKQMIANATNLRIGHCNTFYTIEANAKKYPNKTALIYPRQIKEIPKDLPSTESLDEYFELESYTYAQFMEIVFKYAYVLKNEYGVTNTTTVAFDCVNKPMFIFVWIALWSLGATPAFINYKLTDKSLVHCIKVGRATLTLIDEEVADLVRPYEKDINAIGSPVVYIGDEFHKRVVRDAPAYRAPDSQRHPEHKGHDVGVLIYTSGTTGLPKPAIVSWSKCHFNNSMFALVVRLDSSSVVYSSMPLYHSTASLLGYLSTVLHGGTYVIGHHFSTRTFWTQIKLSKAKFFQYVGETCRYLLNAPPQADERTHGALVGYGNGLRPDVWAAFKNRFNLPTVMEFYGSTEGPFVLTNYQKGEYGIGAVGKYGFLANFLMMKKMSKFAVLDPENEGEFYRDPNTGFCLEAGTNEPGELLVLIKNPQNTIENFQGYLDNPKASNSKLAFDVFKKGDAYFRTGDLMRYDEDSLIYFLDRLGDTFRWKSENVSTNEIEEVVGDHDGIEQVVVVGVKVPNHEGRAGFAVIVPTDPDNKPHPNSLSQHVLSKLPRYAAPVFYKFANEIERTGNNKVQKVLYRSQKLPSYNEDIYYLKDDNYVLLTKEEWDGIQAGRTKL